MGVAQTESREHKADRTHGARLGEGEWARYGWVRGGSLFAGQVVPAGLCRVCHVLRRQVPPSSLITFAAQCGVTASSECWAQEEGGVPAPVRLHPPARRGVCLRRGVSLPHGPGVSRRGASTHKEESSCPFAARFCPATRRCSPARPHLKAVFGKSVIRKFYPLVKNSRNDRQTDGFLLLLKGNLKPEFDRFGLSLRA